MLTVAAPRGNGKGGTMVAEVLDINQLQEYDNLLHNAERIRVAFCCKQSQSFYSLTQESGSEQFVDAN